MRIIYLFLVIFFILSGCGDTVVGIVKEVNIKNNDCELRVEIDNQIVRFIYSHDSYRMGEKFINTRCSFLQKEDKIRVYKRGINYFYEDNAGENIS